LAIASLAPALGLEAETARTSPVGGVSIGVVDGVAETVGFSTTGAATVHADSTASADKIKAGVHDRVFDFMAHDPSLAGGAET
jgi:hypothetical protein